VKNWSWNELIQTIILLLLLINAATATKTNNSFIFEGLGDLHQATSVLHITFDVDVSRFQAYCDLLRHPHEPPPLPLPELQRLHSSNERLTIKICAEVDGFANTKPEGDHHRERRQLGLIGIGLGCAAFGWYQHGKMHQLHQDQQHLHQQLQQQVLALQRQETHLHHLEASISGQSTAMAELLEELKQQRTVDQTRRGLQERHQLLLEFGEDVRRVSLGVQQLRQGRLSPHLLNRDAVNNAMALIRQATLDPAITPIIDQAWAIYELPASYIHTGYGIYQVMIHVPLSTGPLTLLRFRPLPMANIGGGGGAIIIRPGKPMLAHKEGIHIELDEEDLRACMRFRNTYVCHGLTAFHRSLSGSCLGSLFTGELKLVQEACTFHHSTAKWGVERLNSRTMAIYLQESTRVQHVCKHRREQWTLQGNHVLQVNDSCVLQTKDWTVTGHTDLLATERVTVEPDEEPATALPGQPGADKLDAIRLRLINSNRHPEEEVGALLGQNIELEEVLELRNHSAHQDRDHIITYVTVTALFIILFIIMVLRYRYLLPPAVK
jgi:hypothetical protein